MWDKYVTEVGLRPQQIDSLDRVWAAFQGGAKVVSLQAPTGVGKSIIQLALARRLWAESALTSFIVTPQRALQDQLKQWSDLAIMKGRSSYDCGLVHDVSAAVAPCTLDSSVREANPECSTDRCPFYSALSAAVKGPIVVHNYASLLAQSYMAPHFVHRHLLCLDEAHTASSWVRNFATFTMTDDEVYELEPREFTGHHADREFVSWFSGTVAEMERVPNGVSDQLRLTLMRAMAFRSLLPSADTEQSEVPWQAVYDPGWARWTLLPMKVGKLSRILTCMGEKVMLVTATVLDTRLMLAELGLQHEPHEYVEIDAAFDPRNRPIIKKYVGSMGAKSRAGNMDKLISTIVDIANKHQDEAGIIHTVSHEMSGDVAGHLLAILNRPIEILPRGSERDAVIKRFMNRFSGKNAILIGPSLMEGIDAKDDVARWQVMCKVPWPNMGDPVVAELMAMTGAKLAWAEMWYRWKAVQQSVQGFGRVCRSPTDRGVTYLLDRDFVRILNSGLVPKYVTDAVR